MVNCDIAKDVIFASDMFNVEKIREDFPILGRTVYNKPLIYLDNAATTQKPKCVIDAISDAYCNVNANVHRGVHFLSQQATEMLESARETVRSFISAESTEEIIFTRGTTESLNLLAASFAERFLQKDDEIIISAAEHHSNIVPWQMQAQKRGFVIRIAPITESGELDFEALQLLVNPKTKLISITHVSNVLGSVMPIKQIAEFAHKNGAYIAVDGAQSAPHIRVDVKELDVDFFAFSGHKVYGPTGIGVLYGKRELLEQLPPYQGGGEMIKKVTFEHTTYNELPYKFEAGTPDYVGSIALAKAIDYVQELGMENIAAYEDELCAYAVEKLRAIDGIRFIGEPKQRSGVVSFLVGNTHPSDIGTLLDKLGVAVRTGHHCAEPLMDRFGIPGTVRASFALYNTKAEIDAFIVALERVTKMLM